MFKRFIEKDDEKCLKVKVEWWLWTQEDPERSFQFLISFVVVWKWKIRENKYGPLIWSDGFVLFNCVTASFSWLQWITFQVFWDFQLFGYKYDVKYFFFGLIMVFQFHNHVFVQKKFIIMFYFSSCRLMFTLYVFLCPAWKIMLNLLIEKSLTF